MSHQPGLFDKHPQRNPAWPWPSDDACGGCGESIGAYYCHVTVDGREVFVCRACATDAQGFARRDLPAFIAVVRARKVA